jgi:hypothetical protein
MALMVGALIIQGIQPGPRMVEAQPDLFWGLIASMWIGNLMLLVINLPMIGVWVKLLQVPYRFMYPSIMIFCVIGAYSINNNVFDVYRRRGIRRARIPAVEAGVRARAHAARLRAWADDGGASPTRHAAVAWRPDDIPRAPDQREPARRSRPSPCC